MPGDNLWYVLVLVALTKCHTQLCMLPQELQLSGNRLQGGLPDALVRLTQLNTLDLSGNNFTGER